MTEEAAAGRRLGMGGMGLARLGGRPADGFISSRLDLSPPLLPYLQVLIVFFYQNGYKLLQNFLSNTFKFFVGNHMATVELLRLTQYVQYAYSTY